MDDLEARLESHAQAFEGLLSLIPAKQYYGQDNSDQWQRKKQTKEQKRAAKRAKLNPENQKSAKDVMDENERKRKRELGIESDEESDHDQSLSVDKEAPGAGLRHVKKQKIDKAGVDAKVKAAAVPLDEVEALHKAKAEKRKEKRDKKKEKIDRKKEKADAKKAKKQAIDLDEVHAEATAAGQDDDDEANELVNDEAQPADLEPMDMSGLADADEAGQSSAPTTPNAVSPPFDTPADQSAASSTSSIGPSAAAPKETKVTSASAPPTEASTQPAKPKKEKALNLPKIDPEELQARLRARIEELRARRKADGPEGKPSSRQDLLESRRKKSEARKAHKKELRVAAKQEEDRLNNERLRGSGSPLGADIFSPRLSPSAAAENNFSFGRIAFDDGQQADASLSTISDARKKKGPQDTKTALEAAQRKAARLSGYDEAKRADIETKDSWLNMKKRAHGERVRDDTSLLKKALKRKEKVKSKSEKEWSERKEGVAKGIAFKQKKREENLQKRRDESKKGQDRAKAGGAKGGKPKANGAKKKGRPGFEGGR